MATTSESLEMSPALHPPRTRVPTKRLIALVGGAAILAAASWYGWSWWTLGRFEQSTDDAYIGADITPIAPKVPGYIADVAVTDNQVVEAGALLVKLDDRDYRAQLAQAEASVAAQQATLANLDANFRLQQAVIEQSKAETAATAAEVARTKEDVERYHALIGLAASVQRYQQADADNKKALAADLKAHAALDADERRLDVIATQKQQTAAALAQAIAARDLAQLNLSYTEIRSPIAGVVGNRSARVGAYATQGAQLLSVVPSQGLWIDANFKESQLGHMREGQPVSVVADVLPGITFHGHLASLAPATGAEFSVIPPENATGNFTKIVQRVPVRILLDGKDATLASLRPGLSVSAVVDTRPTDAIEEARR